MVLVSAARIDAVKIKDSVDDISSIGEQSEIIIIQ